MGEDGVFKPIVSEARAHETKLPQPVTGKAPTNAAPSRLSFLESVKPMIQRSRLDGAKDGKSITS
jgi:hypothetical protein